LRFAKYAAAPRLISFLAAAFIFIFYVSEYRKWIPLHLLLLHPLAVAAAATAAAASARCVTAGAPARAARTAATAGRRTKS
jgi:hypothetical protein